MVAFNRLTVAAGFLGLCLTLAVRADEYQQGLADPGYRPQSDISAAFIERVASAEIAVFPTIVRTPEDTAFSGTAQPWVTDFLEMNNLGTGQVADTRFAVPELKKTSQWEMFETSMATIGRQLANMRIEADYAVVVELIIPPLRSAAMEVFGIHCFVFASDGTSAFSFLLNSHHSVFNDANLRTTDTGEKGKERLAIESTKLAMLALKAQVDREPGSSVHAEQPGASSVRTRMIDDFESGLPSSTDDAGVGIGFDTFNNATSIVSIIATSAHPPLPGETAGNRVLQLDMDVTGWAGFIHKFESETLDQWNSQDWREFLGLRFWLYGNNTGASLFVDVLDNRKRYSTSDDAERYTYPFRDDFSGWKHVTVPFAKMVRKEIHNRAPNDGLNLSEVHGWAFGNSSSERQITYYIDSLEIYGGRIHLSSDELLHSESENRWRAHETNEGRFRVSVSTRMDPPAGMENSDFPKLAIYSWMYRSRLNGMPASAAELEQILAWARRLDDLIVAERNGFQFATRGGAKQLRAFFYVADVEKLNTLSRQAGEQSIGTRMEFRVLDDPDWQEWTRMGRPSEDEREAAREQPDETAIPASAMPPILKFDGFSVRRPDDYRWRLQRNYRTPHIASFTFGPLSDTHSFNASILIRGLPKEFHTKEAFKSFIDSKVQESGPRFEKLSFASSLTELHGQWAVSYEALFLDKSPSNSEAPLLMTIKGIACLHPLRQQRIIDAFYSERGTESDLDGTLDPVGEELISGTIPER